MSEKKKKKNSLGGLTLGLIAVVALLFMLGGDGNGLGDGSGSGSGSNDTVVNQQQEAQPAATEAQKTVLEVTVSGSDYLFQNTRMDLSTLISQLSNYGKDADIRITADDTATINAMNALTESLSANGFTNYSKR